MQAVLDGVVGVVGDDVEQVVNLAAGQGDHAVGRGWRVRSTAVRTARKALASMARVVQRCQEFQRRTWCWSSPARPFPAWKDSSTVQRRPATRTRTASEAGVAA